MKVYVLLYLPYLNQILETELTCPYKWLYSIHLVPVKYPYLYLKGQGLVQLFMLISLYYKSV